MTKKKLLEKLKDFPDEADIKIHRWSDFGGGQIMTEINDVTVINSTVCIEEVEL